MQTSPESKFTPGPWEMKEVPTQCGRAFRIGRGAMLEPGPKGCCIIYDDYGAGANEHKANAHLIASAPDMASFVKKHADAGDVEAQALWRTINGAS